MSSLALPTFVSVSEEQERAVGKLSPRERECMILVAKPYRTGEIARILGITEPTVNRHVEKARAKLGGVSRPQAARIMAAVIARADPRTPGEIPHGDDPVVVNFPDGTATFPEAAGAMDGNTSGSIHDAETLPVPPSDPPTPTPPATAGPALNGNLAPGDGSSAEPPPTTADGRTAPSSGQSRPSPIRTMGAIIAVALVSLLVLLLLVGGFAGLTTLGGRLAGV